MGQIKFPPSSPLPDSTVKECFTYGEPLTIQFADSGYFSHDNPEAFTPNPPTGNFVAPVTIGPYNAVAEDQEVTFSFFDTAVGKHYKYCITIKPACS